MKNSKIRHLCVVAVVAGATFTVAACATSASAPIPSTSPSKVTAVPVPSQGAANPLTGLLMTQKVAIPGSVLTVPATWTRTVTAGASQSWIVTTAPDSRSLGVARLTADTIPVTEKVLQDTAATLTDVSRRSTTPQTKLISSQLGYLQTGTPNGYVEAWIASKAGSGTYLFLLGPTPPPSGTASPSPVAPNQGQGTAADQAQAVITAWLP